jgi:hypothetical protein
MDFGTIEHPLTADATVKHQFERIATDLLVTVNFFLPMLLMSVQGKPFRVNWKARQQNPVATISRTSISTFSWLLILLRNLP